MKAIGSSSLIALLFAATFVAPAAASAAPTNRAMAPTYMSSEPSDGEMLDKAPDRVEVTFDEPLDQSSVLTVTDECGRKVDDGEVEVQANTMTVGIALKPIGRYDVDYFARGVGGVTGQESGTFDFMVHSGPSCGKKADDGHTTHGGNKGNHGGNHGGNQNGGGGGYNNHGGHSGSGGDGAGADHRSTTHNSDSGQSHSSTGHAGSGATTHRSGKHGSGKHRSGKHGSGKHGGGKHGAAGAHGLLDILEQNERDEERSLAAGPTALSAPDGQAVALALALSLLMGVIGGWFLRVSGAR